MSYSENKTILFPPLKKSPNSPKKSSTSLKKNLTGSTFTIPF